MDSTPIKNEFITSTPKIPLCDSGCLDDEGFCKNPSIVLSPVSLNSVDSAYFSRSSINASELDSSSIVRKLDFSAPRWTVECNSTQATIQEKRLIGNFPPLSQELFKKPVKEPSATFRTLKRVDFLNKFKQHNMQHVISNVLRCLAPIDLCRMICVSKTWLEVVTQDAKANTRRRQYLKKMKAQRENMPMSNKCSRRYASLINRNNLSDVSNTKAPESSKKNLDSAKFMSFLTEGRKLQSGTLMPCPVCRFAAKEIDNKYICTECGHAFAKQAFMYDSNMDTSLPSFIIGSKHSKRNLRRL